MDIKALKKEGNKLTLLINGSDNVYINTLRRMILTNVPTLAIRKINITKNSSALFDEMIAQRLGLIPFTTDLKSFDLIDECSCKKNGCSKCQVSFTLKAEGPITDRDCTTKGAD